MDDVRRERIKLTANNLDRASTGCLVVGVFGQFLTVTPQFNAVELYIGLIGWLAGASALHWAGRRILGQLGK